MSAEFVAGFHVLHLRSSAGLYGAEYVVLGLIPALAKAGIGSTLLCLDNQHMQDQPLYAKAREMHIPSVRVACRGRFDFATVKILRDVLTRHPNAVLHVHDYKSALYAWLARGRRQVPIVATSHGQFSSSARLHLYHRLESALMRRFDRVCVVSAEMRPLLTRAGVNAARITLIENGIDTSRFAPGVTPIPRADFGIADDAVIFGAAMRLTEQKNPFGLLEAFAQVQADIPQAALLIAGDGPLREAAQARAVALGIGDNVHFVGARDDMERFYTLIQVFVLPSHYEGLPLALLEAMAAECAVAVTAVGQVPQVLKDLPVSPVPAASVDALAQAMRSALSLSGARRLLRQRVLERYSVEAMAQQYSSVYRQVWRLHERAVA